MGDRQPPWQSPSRSAEPAGANSRVWRKRELAAGLISGLLVAVLTVGAQWLIDDRREDRADKRENVRFIRQLAADGTAHQGSLRGMDLSDSNLSGLDLSGADLSGADLSGADLSWADLTGAILTGADLTGARLEWTHLFGVNLSDAILVDAILHEPLFGSLSPPEGVPDARDIMPNLIGADLSGVTIRYASFAGANLSWANFSDVTFAEDPEDGDRATSFVNADMVGTKFYGTDISNVHLPIPPEDPDAPIAAVAWICVDKDTTLPDWGENTGRVGTRCQDERARYPWESGPSS